MTWAAEIESAIGITGYASRCPPCHARVRATDDDFVVEEVIHTEGLTSDLRQGYFPVYRVEKKGIDTFHMIEELSGSLKSKVSFGGLKDKRALTVQYVSPTSRRSEWPKTVVGARFSAQLSGFSPRPIGRGDLLGNRFKIVLRECCEQIDANLKEVVSLGSQRMLPNFYGRQRFGAPPGGTHLVGRAVVKKDFRLAVRLILGIQSQRSTESNGELEEKIQQGDYQDALAMIPAGSDLERSVLIQLSKKPEDYVGAIRGVPIKVRRLFVHAYQSFIFNRILSLALLNGEDISTAQSGDNWTEISKQGFPSALVRGVSEEQTHDAIPLIQVPGYAYRDYRSRFDSLAGLVMHEETVSPKDFYIKEMQELSAEGWFRVPHLTVMESSHVVDQGTATLKFTLGRGQYATVLLREVLKISP